MALKGKAKKSLKGHILSPLLLKKFEKIEKRKEEYIDLKELKYRFKYMDKEQRINAIKGVSISVYTNEEIVEFLTELLDDENMSVRKTISNKLMEQGDIGYVLSAALFKKWFEKAKGKYMLAIKLAKTIRGKKRELLIKYLLSNKFIDSKYWNIRRDVCRFLGEAEFDDKRIAEAIANKLRDSSINVRIASAKALSRIGLLNKVNKKKVLLELIKVNANAGNELRKEINNTLRIILRANKNLIDYAKKMKYLMRSLSECNEEDTKRALRAVI